MTECQHKFFNELKKKRGQAEVTHWSQRDHGSWGNPGSPGISCKLPCNSDVCSVTILLTFL